MSKATIPSNIAEMYKNSEREIKVKGDLKLISKEIVTSNNLMQEQTVTHNATSTGDSPSFQYTNGILDVTGWLEGGYQEFSTNIQLAPGTYTFSVNNISETQTIYRIDLYYGSSTAFSIGYGYYSRTFSQTININKIRINWRSPSSNGYVTNQKTTLMLNSGSTQLDFEEAGTHEQETTEDFIIGENLVEHITPTTNKLPEYSYTWSSSNSSVILENSKITVDGHFFTDSTTTRQFTDSYTDFPVTELPAGTYTLSITPRKNSNHNIQVGILNSQSAFYQFLINSNNTLSETKEFPNGLRISGIEITFDATPQGNDYDNDEFDLMLSAGDIALPFEPSVDHVEFVDESNCQILDFRIDEKTDLYCETTPFSELSIDVENTQGYFSDFTENSIVEKLNSDCYMTFYLNIDNTGWYWAWQMQYYGLTATNEKATLTFRPYPMSVFNSIMYDKNKYFTKEYWTVNSSGTNDVKTYVMDNYGIIINGISTGARAFIMNKKTIKDLSNLLFYYGTLISNITETPRSLISLRNNDQIWYSNILETMGIYDIDYDFLLEKPLITKETLDELILNTKEIKTYTASQINMQKNISSNFINSTDIIVIYGEDYIFDGITTNDITITGGTLESISTPTGAYKHYLLLEISGTVGATYTININVDLFKTDVVENTQEIIRKQNTLKASNKIEIDNNMTSSNDYWKELVQKLDKKIKFRIPALPDLEVGDMVRINYEDNTQEKYVITEIHTSWSRGFIMEIIGYHLNEN